MTKPPARHTLLATALMCLAGCGGTPEELIQTRIDAAKAYDEAEAALRQADFQGAKEKYETALEFGNLQLDSKGAAMVKHAVCLAGLGQLDEASKKLDELERLPVPQDLVLSARSYVLKKQGKQRDSRLAWSRARRINQSVPKFDFAD